MKRLGLLLLLLATISLSSCAAGPHQLRRSVDDWDHSMYVDNPLLDGVLWIVPVFPIAEVLAYAGDFLVVDAWYFWTEDLWDGEGTGFDHYKVDAQDGSLGSLMNDDSKFFTKD